MNQQLLNRISQSVFTIYKERDIWRGSGFVIGANGICVTNYHVLKDALSSEVKMKNGEKFNIRNIIAFDPKVDLVVFRLDLPRNKTLLPLKIENHFPRPGEDVINISAPAYSMLEQTIANGNVSAVRKHKDHGYIIQHTAPTSSGSSGSPTFNMRGEVIGVESFSIAAPASGRTIVQNINFAIASRKLTELLQASKGKRPIELLDMTDNPLITRNVKLAMLSYAAKNQSQAIEILKTENRNNPKNYLAYEFLGWIYYHAGNYAAGSDAYLKANKISHRAENLAGYAINYSAAARASGDKALFQEAYRWLNESVHMKPDPSVYYEMACLLYDYTVKYRHLNPKQLANALNSVNLSLQYYNKPAQFRFYTDWACITRGLIKEALGEQADALNDYEYAIKLDPRDYRGFHARGKLLGLHFKEFSSGLKDAAMALNLLDNRYYTLKADVLHTQALIYYKWYGTSGDDAHLQAAIKKLEQAYSIYNLKAYLDEKQRIIDEAYNQDDEGDEIPFEGLSDEEDEGFVPTAGLP